MDMDKFKRDYKYKTNEGGKSFTWLIIVCAAIIVLLAFFMR